MVTGRDCEVLRVVTGDDICREWDDGDGGPDAVMTAEVVPDRDAAAAAALPPTVSGPPADRALVAALDVGDLAAFETAAGPVPTLAGLPPLSKPERAPAFLAGLAPVAKPGTMSVVADNGGKPVPPETPAAKPAEKAPAIVAASWVRSLPAPGKVRGAVRQRAVYRPADRARALAVPHRTPFQWLIPATVTASAPRVLRH
jgi:hypothetical protein